MESQWKEKRLISKIIYEVIVKSEKSDTGTKKRIENTLKMSRLVNTKEDNKVADIFVLNFLNPLKSIEKQIILSYIVLRNP